MPPELIGQARSVAAAARPGEQVEAYFARSRSTEVRVQRGEVESVSSAEVGGVGVRVVVDGRQGYAWVGSLDGAVTADALAEARDNARFGGTDEHLGLPSPDDAALPDGGAPPALDVWRESLASYPAAAKVAIALDLERAVRARDPRIRGVRVSSYSDGASEVAVANSLGLEAALSHTRCSCSVLALAGDGAGTQTGFGFSVGREPSDLDVETATSLAVERSLRLLGATQPHSRRLPVVLDPMVTASLLGVVGAALNGEGALKGRSMFARRRGDVVAGGGVSLIDDPTDGRSFGARAADDEGVPTRPVALIEAGRLRAFLHNTYTGRRSATGTTGSAVRVGYRSTPGVGPRSLRLKPGPASPEELLRRAEGGLFVQAVTGLHSGASPVSGDFSVGADGLLIRDGVLAEPVREVNIASTLPRMLAALVVGDDVTWLPGGAAGVTVLVPEMTMSGA